MTEIEKNLSSALAGDVVDWREDVSPEERKAEPRIWIFARKDLPLSVGKFGAQAGHAAGTCMVLSDRRNSGDLNAYLARGQSKAVVGVDDEAELLQMVKLCREEMLVSVLVKDAGRTELKGKTYTVGAVGPCLRSDLPKKVQRLRMLRDPGDTEISQG